VEISETVAAAPDGAGVLGVDRVFVTAAMPRELAEAATLAASKEGTTRSAVVRAALRQLVADAAKNGGRS